MQNSIAYQGHPGAYSHLACRRLYPTMDALACESFSQALRLVERSEARLAMIPFENSTAGRVEEIYRQLPRTSLAIIGEHFEPVNHCLLGIPGARAEDLEVVGSHPQALAQCDENLARLGVRVEARVDTAGAALDVAGANDLRRGAIASKLAAELYGLDVLREYFQDVRGNTTRFLILAREGEMPRAPEAGPCVTSVIFRTRNIPAALYKCLGGFATNGLNLTKLESYAEDGQFGLSGFYLDIIGHPDERSMRLALQELDFFADSVRILGVYAAHPGRFAAPSERGGSGA